MWRLMVWVAGVVLLFVVVSADFVWVFVFLVTCLFVVWLGLLLYGWILWVFG